MNILVDSRSSVVWNVFKEIEKTRKIFHDENFRQDNYLSVFEGCHMVLKTDTYFAGLQNLVITGRREEQSLKLTLGLPWVQSVSDHFRSHNI